MKRESLSRSIYHDLKSRIRKGEFPVGSRLPAERTLAEHYNSSRIPVRDALDLLIEEAVVERRPYAGCVVASIPPISPVPHDDARPDDELNAFLEALQLRCLIESEAAREAALSATKEQLDQLQSSLFETISQIRLLKADEDNRFYDADAAFHRLIAEISGNDFFLKCMDASPTLISWQQHWSLSYTKPKDEVISYHTRIFEAILDHDPDSAYQAMYEHLSHVGTLVQQGQEIRSSKTK